jgi:hypothetical protein
VCVLVVILLQAVSFAQRVKPCFETLAACLEIGCAEDGSDHALLNKLKRRKPVAPSTTPTRLTSTKFEDTQEAVDALDLPHGHGTDLTAAQRRLLKDIDGTGISEGGYVELVGFIANDTKNPRANGGESVNCNIRRQANNDFHINLVEDVDQTEFEGLVTEMVPQDRRAEWTMKKLRLVRRMFKVASSGPEA